jgi:hypothetical protein
LQALWYAAAISAKLCQLTELRSTWQAYTAQHAWHGITKVELQLAQQRRRLCQQLLLRLSNMQAAAP